MNEPRPLSEDDQGLPPARIVCAALLLRSGLIICGPRHYDKRMRTQIDACKADIGGAVEGFVDQFGNFHSREKAYVIAHEQRQFRRESYGGGKLYSENLY